MRIILTTLHAKYAHASLALPCLAAYCADIDNVEIDIRELTVNEPREHILKLIMAEQADLIAFSCYIWNIETTLKIASDIKMISPQTWIALGGPEVSFEIFELMQKHQSIDFVIKGEGEETFRKLVLALTQEPSCMLHESLGDIESLFFRDGGDIASGTLKSANLYLDSLPSPFTAGLVDLSKPLIYYETSRGCPFSCAFCLSSVEGVVRSFSLERIKADLLFLLDREVAQIKLVDRTFNYDSARADAIWKFIIEHNRSSHFHFEIAADLLTDHNLTVLAKVPENTFRFEIGIQSTSQETLALVKRSADLQRIIANVRRLKTETSIELHLDLIAGLPGEDYDAFLASLQTVADLQPHDLQIEPLKLLKGSPMRAIGRRESYQFSEFPPYTILCNPWLSYDDICRIETIGRLLDLFNKHGGFLATFATITEQTTFATALDQMARVAVHENLSSLSCLRVFELFARLAEAVVAENHRDKLHDALFFDYSRREMPLLGKLPSFAASQQNKCSWPGVKELPSDLQLPKECRIKTFRYKFMGDYATDVSSKEATSITFIYISGAGRGLQVLVSPTAR